MWRCIFCSFANSDRRSCEACGVGRVLPPDWSDNIGKRPKRGGNQATRREIWPGDLSPLSDLSPPSPPPASFPFSSFEEYPALALPGTPSPPSRLTPVFRTPARASSTAWCTPSPPPRPRNVLLSTSPPPRGCRTPPSPPRLPLGTPSPPPRPRNDLSTPSPPSQTHGVSSSSTSSDAAHSRRTELYVTRERSGGATRLVTVDAPVRVSAFPSPTL